MKYKLLALLVLIIGIIGLASCGKTADKSETTTKSTTKSTTVSQQSKTTDETTGEGASVIAKSGNNYSNSEKKQAANELQTEIDSLINSIDSLDSGSESDMTIE